MSELASEIRARDGIIQKRQSSTLKGRQTDAIQENDRIAAWYIMVGGDSINSSEAPGSCFK